jgi:hypothetical protein
MAKLLTCFGGVHIVVDKVLGALVRLVVYRRVLALSAALPGGVSVSFGLSCQLSRSLSFAL